MAENLRIPELRDRLSSSQKLGTDTFAVLRAIADLMNVERTESVGREMLLRALQWRDAFGQASVVLDSLARVSGLFPYAKPDSLSSRDQLAYECHRPGDDAEFVFHREQSEVYRRLMAGDSVILSAPTSFGKSRIIDAVVASEQHNNIVVVVPTLALIDETRRRLSKFSGKYKIVTHLSQHPGERNIFVLTAERVVAYAQLPKVDFFVIDEFYKMGAMEEDESRTVALNEAFYRLSKDKAQFYLLGPSIKTIPPGIEEVTCPRFLYQGL